MRSENPGLLYLTLHYLAGWLWRSFLYFPAGGAEAQIFLFSLTCTAVASGISVRLSPFLWENSLYSLWKWAFPLWPSYLSQGTAPMDWKWWAVVLLCIPYASFNKKLLAGLLSLSWFSCLYHLLWDEWEGESKHVCRIVVLGFFLMGLATLARKYFQPFCKLPVEDFITGWLTGL